MLPSNTIGSMNSIEYLANTSIDIHIEGSGPPLILLHGLQSDLNIWSGVCEHLTCVEKIRFSFPGRGKAIWPEEGCSIEQFYSIEGFAELLFLLVKKMNKPVSIAGWSMGAIVALEYVKRYGTCDVNCLVLCSGLSRVKGVSNTFRAKDDQGTLKEISERSEKPGLKAVADQNAVLHCWKSMQNFDCREALQAIDVPTLIIHGAEDQDCPFSEAVLMSKKIPKSELISIDDCGHLILTERPEFVGIAISKKIKELMAA